VKHEMVDVKGEDKLSVLETVLLVSDEGERERDMCTMEIAEACTVDDSKTRGSD
jgi:hypothetical protein